ncbi:MAG: hypothetical protein J2P41_22690 [Blastocatellia bacterium]|nr:hypothetical protein [Blastocatellia bacterium]
MHRKTAGFASTRLTARAGGQAMLFTGGVAVAASVIYSLIPSRQRSRLERRATSVTFFFYYFYTSIYAPGHSIDCELPPTDLILMA